MFLSIEQGLQSGSQSLARRLPPSPSGSPPKGGQDSPRSNVRLSHLPSIPRWFHDLIGDTRGLLRVQNDSEMPDQMTNADPSRPPSKSGDGSLLFAPFDHDF